MTWNLDDFPKSVIGNHGIEVWTPDDLLFALLGENEDLVIEVMREHRGSLKNPPRSSVEYLTTLDQQGLSRSVAAVRWTGMEV